MEFAVGSRAFIQIAAEQLLKHNHFQNHNLVQSAND